MTPVENHVAWKIHRDAADAAKARGACYDCAQHAGFRAVEKAGLAQPTLDLYKCSLPRCQRATEAA